MTIVYCISPQVCDGKNDCGHWLDEPRDQCGHNECERDNGGCDQVSETVSECVMMCHDVS